jgi:Uma2 family endonuclease
MPTFKRRWTAADLEDLPEDGARYEVIDGELFMTPAPAVAHQRAIVMLWALLEPFVSARRIGEALIAPADIEFSPTRLVQPDLFVWPLADGRRPARFADVRRLLLAVEVLSPSSARADRVAKRTIYREEGVAEYWIVDLDARTIERSTPQAPLVEVMADRLLWSPEGATAPLDIDVAAYFARVLDD